MDVSYYCVGWRDVPIGLRSHTELEGELWWYLNHWLCKTPDRVTCGKCTYIRPP